jgi:peptidoglycan/xylan/chitin deacetylase (PgdA/CDA1 family)
VGLPAMPVVVRPREIWRTPPPEGGSFLRHRVLPRAVSAVPSLALGTYCVDTDERVVSLTYDDGPHPEHTPRILDVLAAQGAAATFFVLARQVRKHPEVVRRIVADGHEVALHGDDHTSLATLTTREALARVRSARAVVEDTTGVRLMSYRPPYGTISVSQAAAVRATGLRLVIWSSDATDWVHAEESVVSARALEGAFPGGIVLLHDDRGDPETLGPGERLPAFDRAYVLDALLEGLGAAGYTTQTVARLLAGRRHVRSLVRARG